MPSPSLIFNGCYTFLTSGNPVEGNPQSFDKAEDQSDSSRRFHMKIVKEFSRMVTGVF